MGVATNAALATLTVSESALAQDLLLQWVCHLASEKQVKVDKLPDKKKAPPVLSLTTQNTTLTQRNAILRALCGPALHYALDNAPHYLMGGPTPMAAGGCVQFMSLADSLRKSQDTNASTDVLPQLESILGRNSFLLGTSQPALADYDVALALATHPDCQSAWNDYPNVARWSQAVLSTMQAAAPPSLTASLPSPAASSSPPLPPPVFYDGSQPLEALLTPEAPKTAKQAKGGQVANPKEKQPNQQQQKQQEGNGKKKDKNKPGAAKGGGGGNQAPESYDITALDIRVGKITKVWPHPEAEKLFCEEIDLGTETRQIASGLRPFYQTQDMQDRTVLVLCNLKKRNLVGFPSHGMVLCASNADHTAVEFVVPPEGSALGERVQFEGLEGEAQPENKVAKKKIFEQLAPDLKTNDQGQVVWKNAVAKTQAGVVQAIQGMANASVS